jgi:hypothetical protein
MNCKPTEKAAIANVAPKQNRATPSLLTTESYTRTPPRSHRSSGPRKGSSGWRSGSVGEPIAFVNDCPKPLAHFLYTS